METRTLIEAFSPTGPPADVYEVFRIRPVVVDSSFLLPDLFWTTRNLTQSRFLDSIAFGVLRPFAAHHVWAEVPRKIGETAAEFGVDSHDAEAIWWMEYVPKIRFVDVGDLRIPRARAISGRDATDAPTFALAGLLAPIVVLAPDRDISDLGIAASDWLAVVRAGEELTFVASSAMGGLFGINMGGYSIAGTVKGLASGLKHPAGQVILGAAALYGACTFRRWWPSARSGIPRLGRAIGRFAEVVAPMVETISEQYAIASVVWEQAAYRSEGHTREQEVARVLATCPAPISRTAIVSHLLPQGTERERRNLSVEVANILSTRKAYVVADRRRWQLGKTGPDFAQRFEPALVKEREAMPPAVAAKLKSLPRPSPRA